MKTISPLNCRCLPATLLITLLFCRCTGDKAPPGEGMEDKERTGAEVTLNLCADVVDYDDVMPGLEHAYEWVQKTPSTTFDPLEENVSRQAVEDLKASVESQVPNQNCEGYFTGVNIHIGLQGNGLRLFYVPAWFCTDNAVVDPDTAEFEVNPLPDTLLYDEGSFVPASGALAAIQNYQQNVVFNESAGTRTFNPSGGPEGDTRAVIMPFQVLFALMTQNERDTFTIWHYAEKVSYSGTADSIRQALLFSPLGMAPDLQKGKSGGFGLSAAYTGNFADRSHLCPPSCNEVSFIISPGSNDCQ